MKILDCSTFNSAVESLSQITDIDREALLARLRQVEDGNWGGHPPTNLWERAIGRDCSFDGIYWFHLTRAINPESFKQKGILPRQQMAEEIWSMIFDLIGSRLTDAQKSAFRCAVEDGKGHNGHLRWAMQHGPEAFNGPFGLLVREAAFRSQEIGNHDYLGTPELIEDICCSECYGIRLFTEFVATSQPCIVKFVADPSRTDAPQNALFYVWTKLHGHQMSDCATTCYDGNGQAVPPGRIIEVEVNPNPG